jgi:hypothetical protein
MLRVGSPTPAVLNQLAERRSAGRSSAAVSLFPASEATVVGPACD